MKLYIAGGSAERVLVMSLMLDATLAGHEVTHDWTACEGYDRPSTEAERRAWAALDMAGVHAADALWLVAPEERSEGSACELGAALALGKRVIVSGPHAKRESRIFCTLAEVYDTHEEALFALSALPALPMRHTDPSSSCPKCRIKDQSPPVANGKPPVWGMVIEDVEHIDGKWALTRVLGLVVADMRERDRIGRARYGMPLQAHNGRDALVDAYQEALDLVVYLRQHLAEGHFWPTDRRAYKAALDLVLDVRALIDGRERERAEVGQ